ncbi:hypothetical protein [Pseudomonas fluorescens]
MGDKKKGLIGRVKKGVGDFPVSDYIEAITDACTESEALKAIPVVSTGVAIVKAFLHFKEGRFKRKVELFYESAGEFSDDEWEAFSETLDEEGKKEDFLSELLEIIERIDEEQKAKIIGGIFRRLVKKEISYAQFEDQVRVTNGLQILNIHFFMHGYQNQHLLEESLGDVMAAQRVVKRKIELAVRTINIAAQKQEQYIKVSYDLTQFGGSYLTTLHQVYIDKIQPENLYVG